jgi:hypothetical protein
MTDVMCPIIEDSIQEENEEEEELEETSEDTSSTFIDPKNSG